MGELTERQNMTPSGQGTPAAARPYVEPMDTQRRLAGVLRRDCLDCVAAALQTRPKIRNGPDRGIGNRPNGDE